MCHISCAYGQYAVYSAKNGSSTSRLQSLVLAQGLTRTLGRVAMHMGTDTSDIAIAGTVRTENTNQRASRTRTRIGMRTRGCPSLREREEQGSLSFRFCEYADLMSVNDLGDLTRLCGLANAMWHECIRHYVLISIPLLAYGGIVYIMYWFKGISAGPSLITIIIGLWRSL